MADEISEGVALRLPKESARYAEGVPLTVRTGDDVKPAKKAARKRTAKKAAAKKTAASPSAPTTEES